MKIKMLKELIYLIGLSFFCIIYWVSCRGDGIGIFESIYIAGDSSSSFARQIQPIFDTNCIRCHAPGGIGFIQTGGSQNNGLNLTSGNSHGKLVNQPTFQSPDVEPKLRVSPGDVNGSYIVQKISSVSPKSGKRMPFDGPPFLTSSEIQSISNWISDGAPNN